MPPALTWTQEEDEQLRELVAVHGTKAWAKIASLIRTKGSKQCRRRWKNFLNMSAKTCSWSPEEDATLIDAHRRLGNRWTEISKIFGDRTDNAVKNRWHALIRKHPNLDRGGGGGDDSDAAPRSNKRRRTRASAGVEDDSDQLDSGRYGHSMQYTSSGGISAAAMPTPFDRTLTAAGGGSGGSGMAAAAAAAVATVAANQRAAAAQTRAAMHQVQQYAAMQQAAAAQAWQAQQEQAGQAAAMMAGQQPYCGHHPGAPPLQITVAKTFLSPWEQQLADQINAMNLPVHVEVAPAPLPAAIPLADASLPLPPDSTMLPEMVANRSSWKQYVEKIEKLDEPGDSKGLQELLDWFSSNTSGGATAASGQRDGSKDMAPGFGSRRLTRSLSKSGSGSAGGSGSLSGDHRQLLVKLMSRGLEVRSSSDQDTAAIGNGGMGSLNPSPQGGAGTATAAAARFDPFRRTRSSSGKSTQEREGAAAAAAAAVQQSGLAAAAAAAAAGAAAGRRAGPQLPLPPHLAVGAAHRAHPAGHRLLRRPRHAILLHPGDRHADRHTQAQGVGRRRRRRRLPQQRPASLHPVSLICVLGRAFAPSLARASGVRTGTFACSKRAGGGPPHAPSFATTV